MFRDDEKARLLKTAEQQQRAQDAAEPCAASARASSEINVPAITIVPPEQYERLLRAG